MSSPEWLDHLVAKYRRVREPAEQLCRPAFDERAAQASLYTSSGRLSVGPNNRPRAAVTAEGMDTREEPRMPHTTLQPELVERRRLIAALDQATLKAVSTHSEDETDRAMARAELAFRGGYRPADIPVTDAEDEAWDRALGEGRN